MKTEERESRSAEWRKDHLGKNAVSSAREIVSFPKRTSKLTRGQGALLLLMVRSIKKEKPIEIEDVVKIYNKHVRQCEERYTLVGWDHDRDKPEYGFVEYTSDQLQQKAKQWLVANLGVLILKEK